MRYDGTSVYLYEHNPSLKNTITDNRINAITEDIHNNLWIGTARGLVIYNPEEDNFNEVDSLSGNVNHLSSRYVTALSSDRMGRMWIGTHGQGLNVYDPGARKFEYFVDNANPNQTRSSNYITALHHSNDTIWVSTKGGLKIFQAAEMNQVPLRASEVIGPKEITQVLKDVNQNIWLSTIDREVIKLTPTGGDYTIETTLLQRKQFPEDGGNILTLATDDKGNVWAAGENTCLHFIDGKTGHITRHEADEGSDTKLPTNSIRSLFVDNTGITWIGSYTKGAFMIDNRAKKFELFQRGRSSHSASGSNVKGIIEDKNGRIWVACDGGGIAILDNDKGELVFQEDLNNKIGTKFLTAILLDTKGSIWAGSWGRGVYRIDTKSREVKNFKLVSHGFGDNKVFSLYQDRRNTLWIGSAGSGLFYFDPNTSAFVGLNEDLKSDYIRKSAYVAAFSEDAEGALWVGTLFGLYRLTFNHDNVYDVKLFEKDGNPGSIASYEIQSLYHDNNRNLWIGTGDFGVGLLRYGTSDFKNFQKEDGLPSNLIRGILSAADGSLWISSAMGLTNYDPVKKVFRNYTKNDGLYTNEFNTRACLIGTDGRFYFGSDKGLVAFHPDSIRANPIQPQVYLTDLKLNSQSVKIGEEGSPLSKHISLTEEIELNHNQRAFALEFAAINYGQSSQSHYCYKLEGFDADWNCVGSDTRATYTNLDPGRYVFLVKAFSSDGVESVKPARLVITIHQAPWKTWWAVSAYTLIMISLAYILIRVRLERVKIKNQLEFERLAREQEHALTESKTQFFTNISHEFRTPLSLISMPLETLLSDKGLPDSVRERLHTMQTNTGKMMRLVNELMDFSKLENGKLKLSVRHGELVEFTSRVADTFNDVAAKRNIHFKVHPMTKSIDGWFDQDKIEKIVVNILSNAFKFTCDNGAINVVLNSRDYEGRRWFELAVIDDGVGIPAEELPFVFDKFYQATSAEKISNPGTGVGLALTKGLIDLHRGRIMAESTPGVETRFVICIPIDRNSYETNEIDSTVNDVPAQTVPPEVVDFNFGDEPVDAEEDRDRPRILIIEDNDELRRYIAHEFRKHFNVIEASNGNEGLEAAFEKSPDLIVSDVLMPGKSGIELCKELKQNIKTSHIPFIMLTAKASVEDQISGVSNGADVYITKPFSIRFLIAQVNQVIETREFIYSRFSQDVHLMPAKVASNELDQAFLQQAIDYVIQNLQDPQLGVDSLAAVFNLSRKQVYRKVKGLTGKSAVDFIRMIRLKEALKLMDTHRYTLSEIAFETGFNSASYFTRCFKDQFGKAPSEYLESGSVHSRP